MLQDVRVLEVSMLAPSALGMYLADLGADVIKVEDPTLGDYVRTVRAGPAGGASTVHRQWNRGKRSIAIDLRSPAGVAVFENLARRSDVVIEGLRPGALDRRGVGYDQLRVLNPKLVFVSISGFGQFGPYRDVASHRQAFDAYAGLADPLLGEDGLPSIPMIDVSPGIQVTPMLGALGTLAGVIRARATGEGCTVDVAECDGGVHWNASAINGAAQERRSRDSDGREPTAPPTPASAPSTRCQYYATADGRYVVFMALEQKFFENFAAAVGRPDIVALSRPTQRVDHEHGNTELRAALTEIFRSRPLGEWRRLLEEADIALLPVNVGDEVLDDPHFVARTRWLDAETHGTAMMAVPIHTVPPLPEPRPAPSIGEHTDEVLRDVLGHGIGEIEALTAAGAFGARSSRFRLFATVPRIGVTPL